MIKVNVSFDAMKVIAKDAHTRGFVHREEWDGIHPLRGLGQYVEWLSEQELKDMRPFNDDYDRLKVGRTPDWNSWLTEERVYRLSIKVKNESAQRFVEKGIALGMLPRSVGASAYIGLILEAIGKRYVKIMDEGEGEGEGLRNGE